MEQRVIHRRAPVHGWICAIMVITIIIPPTGLEFHNTQLLPNSPSHHSAAVDAPIPPQVPKILVNKN